MQVFRLAFVIALIVSIIETLVMLFRMILRRQNMTESAEYLIDEMN